MMKRILQIVLLGLVAGPASLSAVVVPQTSTADYIFTAPRLTNHIHGVLIDTTNAYRVIRSEDIDWLKEAFAERLYITYGEMPSKNGLAHGVGPEVKRDDVPRQSLSTGWLDGGAPLLSGIRLYDSRPAFTNIYSLTEYTNGVTNAFSVIEMPMTNGTTSVFTNRWSCGKKFPVTTVVTNIGYFTDVDMCHGVDGEPFPAYSNANRTVWWSQNETRFPNVRYFADAREVLRGTVRLADNSSYLTCCNPTYAIFEHVDDAPYYRAETNLVQSVVGYSYLATWWGADRTRPEHSAYYSEAATRFSSSLVTNGGVPRVAIEATYLHCQFYYHRRKLEGSGSGFLTEVSTNVVLRLADPILDVSGEKAICRVLIAPYSICSTCASASGAPVPPTTLSYRESEGHESFWTLDIDSITIFYSITPATKLPDW